MKLTVKSDQDNVAEIDVAGPVTQDLLAVAGDALTKALGPSAYSRKLLLDLRNAEHIDTSGINWLLTMHRRARDAGGRLVLFSIPPLVDNVLRVLRMHTVFEIAPNREDARSLLGGSVP